MAAVRDVPPKSEPLLLQMLYALTGTPSRSGPHMRPAVLQPWGDICLVNISSM